MEEGYTVERKEEVKKTGLVQFWTRPFLYGLKEKLLFQSLTQWPEGSGYDHGDTEKAQGQQRIERPSAEARKTKADVQKVL